MVNNFIELRRRDVYYNDICLPVDLPPLLRRIYLQRGIKKASELERSTKYLLPWQMLDGIDTAVSLLYYMLQNKRRILVIGDFDVDGATSTALTVLALRSMGGNIDFLIPDRFKHGYGLTSELVEEAIIYGTDMILTVDNGISSHSGVNTANQYGIPVIITDHHLPSMTLPSAEAIVNPNLKDSRFPSRSLAGVGVAFYLMLALRAYLRQKNWFVNGQKEPNLAIFLDLVALGTVADLVPLDANNRILVWQGINRIRTGKCCKGISALLELTNCNTYLLSARDLSFIIGPKLNAAGRLANMSIGVSLLLTEHITQARRLARILHSLNQKRKQIENSMQYEALKICKSLEKQESILPLGLIFYHPKWHQGIIGILASRLKERFQRPVITFASVGNGMLKGSGRSIIGLHLRDILENINMLFPSLITKFGGHAMAVGLLLEEKKYEEFCQHFIISIKKKIGHKDLNSIIWSDGELYKHDLSLKTAEMLLNAGPWGQEFPEPVFDGHFKLVHQQLVGKNHLKVIVKHIKGGPQICGIAFNINTNLWPNSKICYVKLAYKLNINEYRGNRSMQLIIDNIWPKV
ncbi:single-stranded-DNA-specific exonuclease RecJ [Pantoea sp. Aalb]|uniref:single-stranded-DNA-specific exonuclease RecJ n=1 Tax=Pantoea sp. Aalb TaxID=2576762 RepID=UPI001327A34B|nr:single-stranded-DNA-specific exonuclease RecJ [Pantoea sp. Aalb]MXP67738.1 single-stranded-DNA-specific exonuclease RecJ [Pantoea sp. Aalb]